MRKLRLFPILALSVLCIAQGCTKEGPEGPAGTPGAQGPAGSNGAPGTPGAGITTYSPWVTTTAADWAEGYDGTDFNNPYYAFNMYDRTAPGVTQAVIDGGIVLSYMKTWPVDGAPRATETAQLPYLVDPFYQDYYDFVIPEPGTIRYLYKSTNLTWFADDLAGIALRYVIISGSVAGGRGIDGVTTYGGYTAAELKGMPYDKVAELFQIPEDGTNIK